MVQACLFLSQGCHFYSFQPYRGYTYDLWGIRIIALFIVSYYIIPSTHQSQKCGEETQVEQEEKDVQSKKVKLKESEIGPSSDIRVSLEMKDDSPSGILGSKSFLK